MEENNNGNGRCSPITNEKTKFRETSYVVEEQRNSHADSSADSSANGGDDSSDKMATVTATVESPMNSTPFWRQNSINSYHSPGSSSGHDTGGSNQNSRGKWGDSSNSNSSTATNSISGATAVGIPQWQSSLESMERSIPMEGKDFVHPRSANKSTGDKKEHGQSTLETSS